MNRELNNTSGFVIFDFHEQGPLKDSESTSVSPSVLVATTTLQKFSLA